MAGAGEKEESKIIHAVKQYRGMWEASDGEKDKCEALQTVSIQGKEASD